MLARRQQALEKEPLGAIREALLRRQAQGLAQCLQAASKCGRQVTARPVYRVEAPAVLSAHATEREGGITPQLVPPRGRRDPTITCDSQGSPWTRAVCWTRRWWYAWE